MELRHPFLSAERRIWLPTAHNTTLPYDIDQLRRLAESGIGPAAIIPKQWLSRLPDAYMSELKNVASASFDVADSLLEDLKRDRHDQPPKPPSHQNAVQIGHRRFAVAVSFPGECRDLVENISNALAEVFGQPRVLYDRFHQVEFARQNLDTYLQHLYANESDLIVIFVCKAYGEKQWCGLEWRAIRDLMTKRTRPEEDFMILRLDDSKLEGWLSIDGYIDISKNAPRQVTDWILQRWSAKR